MASAVPVTAQMVGNAFVTQYYNILRQMPQYIFRFYTDDSHLTRAEAGSTGDVQNASSQNDIHSLVMSTDHKDCRSEIITVDAQDSFNGSVVVLVTGLMHKTNASRKFVQSFFLAPQDRGYYVLNDIFRYMDEETQLPVTPLEPPVHDMSNGVVDMYERLQATSEAEPQMNEYSPAIQEEMPIVEKSGILEQVESNINRSGFERDLSYEIVEEGTAEEIKIIEHPNAVEVQSTAWEEMSSGKKSYASILRAAGGGTFHQAVVKLEHSVPNQRTGLPQIQNVQSKDESTPIEPQVDAKSVYVKNLPANITNIQLTDELKKFGPIKPSNVSVRSNKEGGHYAFVDFDDANSAQSAIEASPVIISGRKIFIEERKSVYLGGRGRGRGLGRGNVQSNILRASVAISSRGKGVK